MARFNLTKRDERFSFSKKDELNNISVVLGWKDGADLDVCAFLVGEDGIIEDDANFVFFNSENRSENYDREKHGSKSNWRSTTRPMSADGSLLGAHDERENDAKANDEGATEVMNLSLAKVSPKVAEIIFCATVYDEKTGFGGVQSPYISVVNDDNGEELCRYTLNEEFSNETAIVAASIRLNDEGEWEFKAEGKGYTGGMNALIDIYA